jgi:hypothetical protein
MRLVHIAPPSCRTHPSLSVVALVATIVLGLSGAALADGSVKPDSKVDPRRKGDAAVITAEPRPQDDPKGLRDAERTVESFQPKGVDLGNYLFLPVIELNETFNNNIFSEQRGTKADFISTVAPEFRLQSRFDTHSLDFYGKAEQVLYHTYTRDNHVDANLMADGRLDITKTGEMRGSVNVYRRAEERGSPDDAKGKTPTETQGLNLKSSIKETFGQFTLSADLTGDRLAFENVVANDGTITQNKDRNRWEGSATGRAAYEMFPGYSAVVQYSENIRSYDHIPNSRGVNRDSTGYRAETGLAVDISQLVRGDFLVGYLRQDYESSQFKSPSGISFRSQLNWTPSKLTLVVPALERSVQETTTTNVAGMVRSGGSLMVRHELERNIILTASGSANFDQYSGIAKDGWTYDMRMKGTYILMPEVYVAAEVVNKIKRSQITDTDFDQFLSIVRLGLRL